MLRFVSAIAACSLITACSTGAQRAERIMSRYGPFCEKLGYERDSDPWRNCILQQDAEANAATRQNTTNSILNRPKTCQVLQPGGQVICY